MNNLLTKGDKLRIVQLAQAGCTLREISVLAGRHRQTVKRVLSEANVKWPEEPGRPSDRVAVTGGEAGDFWGGDQ